MLFDKKFWLRAADRIIKTVAQSMLALLVVSQTNSVFELDWNHLIGVSLFAGLFSLLTAIVLPGVELKEAMKESVLAKIDEATDPEK